MHDERFDKLAKLLVEYSIRLKRNETVLIEAFDIPDEMTAKLIRAARKVGGVPFAQVYHARVNRALALSLPTDGPKTLNGLILEYLQDIPEADVSIKIGTVPMEIVHAQGRTIKTVRLFRPVKNVENTEPSEA